MVAKEQLQDAGRTSFSTSNLAYTTPSYQELCSCPQNIDVNSLFRQGVVSIDLFTLGWLDRKENIKCIVIEPRSEHIAATHHSIIDEGQPLGYDRSGLHGGILAYGLKFIQAVFEAPVFWLPTPAVIEGKERLSWESDVSVWAVNAFG